MAKDVIKAGGKVPAAIAAKMGGQLPTDDLAGGVSAGFPILSFRGKVWRYRESGETNIFEDENGDPVSSIESILVSANPRLSKIFYLKKYEEGDQEAPDCFSVDGIRPDFGSAHPQSKTCAACPHNVWGSKITEAGKKTKACSDARRVAVALPWQLEELGEDAKPALLRVPAASLADLKTFGEKLGAKGLPYFAVVTRLSFDREASYPKLTFRPLRVLTDDEAELIMAMRDSEVTKQIISTAVEIETSQDDEDEDDDGFVANAVPAAITRKPKPAPVVDEEEDEDEDEAPPPPKKKVTKKKVTKKAVQKEPEATPPAADDDLESELDALLNDL